MLLLTLAVLFSLTISVSCYTCGSHHKLGTVSFTIYTLKHTNVTIFAELYLYDSNAVNWYAQVSEAPISLDDVKDSSRILKDRMVLLNVTESFDRSSYGYYLNQEHIPFKGNRSGLLTLRTATLPYVSLQDDLQPQEKYVMPGDRPRPFCLSVFGKPTPDVSVIRGKAMRVPFSWTNGNHCLQVDDSIASSDGRVVYTVIASNCFGNSSVSFPLKVNGSDSGSDISFPWWSAIVVGVGGVVVGAIIMCIVCYVCRRSAGRHVEVSENGSNSSTKTKETGNNSCTKTEENRKKSCTYPEDDRQYMEMQPSNTLQVEVHSRQTLPVKPYATIQISTTIPICLDTSVVGSENGTLRDANRASTTSQAEDYEVMAMVSKNDSQSETGYVPISKKFDSKNEPNP